VPPRLRTRASSTPWRTTSPGRETVVGLFLRLDGLAAAERAAAAVCARVLDRHAAWGFAPVSCEAVLIMPVPEP